MLQAKKPGSVGRIKRTEDMYGYTYLPMLDYIYVVIYTSNLGVYFLFWGIDL